MLNWTQNKADMIARLVDAHIVPIIRGEEIIAIVAGETAEIAARRAAKLIALRLP